jgi:predicted SAM-dependent methyltransferase
MNVNRVQAVLIKVPLVGSSLKWIRDTFRTIAGPRMLRKRVDERAARGEPIRIIIGAGGIRPGEGWIPTNIQFLDLLKDEDWRRGFGGCQVDAIFAEHVWEHLTPADGKAAAAQCFKHLKPGGRLRIAVPDGYRADPAYQEFVRPGGSGPGADDHKILYTYRTLGDMLRSIGFEVDLLEYFDEENTFHRNEWKQSDGLVMRCQGFHERNLPGTGNNYTSLIVDGRKPSDVPSQPAIPSSIHRGRD